MVEEAWNVSDAPLDGIANGVTTVVLNPAGNCPKVMVGLEVVPDSVAIIVTVTEVPGSIVIEPGNTVTAREGWLDGGLEAS